MAMMDNCKKAEIFDDSGNLLCEAAVSCGPMGGLLLDVPAELDYKAQSLFRVLFYDPTMGMVMCRCTLSSPLDLPEGRRSLRCDIAEQISQENRRQDVKVSLGAEVMIHVSRQPGDKVQVPPEGVSAKVFNISAGGVYLRTALALKEGRRLWFDFKEAGGTIPLAAEILRVEDATIWGQRPLYGYGCRLVDLPTRYESQLRSFVFREEMRTRKRD